MNPYDFVPLDTRYPPERRKTVWHNVLVPNQAHPGKLYSGHLNLYIRTETPLFILDENRDGNQLPDPKALREHIRNKLGNQIIPGTSLKGLLRSVVETLGNGCMTVFRVPREYTQNPLPPAFAPCTSNTSLCIACRLFGMMQARQQNNDVFLGKVNVGDAEAYEDSVAFYDPIFTAVLDTPKPRHRSFYLDPQGRYIAGRKFYFHHYTEPRTVDRLLPIRDTGQYRNKYIRPLDSDTEFSARIDFTNLEADEFAALMLAITLQKDMRHKIGYGKPIGLGTIYIEPNELQLIDYSERYKSFHSNRGMTVYDMDSLAGLIETHMESIDPAISATWSRFSTQPAMDHLHRIWLWPPDRTVEYAYPSQQWFKDHSQARISATASL